LAHSISRHGHGSDHLVNYLLCSQKKERPDDTYDLAAVRCSHCAMQLSLMNSSDKMGVRWEEHINQSAMVEAS
jgi:hypothetical protein